MTYYGKRSYRVNRRYNRKARKLSNKYIYGNRSAKSQATQIAALRNRVNKVYKSCKPEIKTVITSAETISYTSESTSSYYRFYPWTQPDEGTADNQRTGNHISARNGVLYLSMEYFNSSETGYHNTESSGCQVRVIIGQWKTNRGPTIIPAIGDIVEFPGNIGPNYTQLALSPLKKGVSAQHAILKDYRTTLTTDRNQKMVKLYVRPKIPYVWVGDTCPNMWALIIATGLHYDSNFTETVKITVSDKLVFTDA